ncbi:MAG: hypothetical protein ACK4WA_07250, partial [Chitinophagales bacterium]
ISNTASTGSLTGQNLTAGTLLQTTGTPTGASLKSAGYRVDTTALKTFINGRTTNTLTNPTNTITSTVNGVAATASAVNTVANSFTLATRQLTTTVNGVAGTAVVLTDGPDSTTASNGLTLTGNDVRLGGALTAATTITTTAANTLALAGLQSGSTADSLVMVNGTTGVVKRMSTSKMSDKTQANNGLSKSGDTVQLGGVLNKVTSIAMGSNTLAFDTTTLFINPTTNRVGVGTTTPGVKLEVNGAAANTSASVVATTTIDFSLSNLAATSNAGTAITLTGLKNGGAYTLAFTATTATGTVTYTASGFTIRNMGTVARTNGKRHIYSFIVIGTDVFVSMSTEN